MLPDLLRTAEGGRSARVICRDRRADGSLDGKPLARIIVLVEDERGIERVGYAYDSGHFTSAFDGSTCVLVPA